MMMVQQDVERFLVDGLLCIGELRGAVASGEESSLERVVGELRALAAMIGAEKLTDEVFRLQLAVRKGDTTRYEALVSRVEQRFVEFREAFPAFTSEDLLLATIEEAEL